MLESGYIKLHRSLLGWEWYDDPVTFKLFLHLLLTVSIKDDRWHGVDVPRGARVCSLPKLSEETHFTINQIRTALRHLESTGSITVKKHPKFSVISMVCWDKYQIDPQAESQSKHRHGHSQGTGNPQQYKKERNKEERNIDAHAHGDEDEMERIRRLAR